MTLAIAVNDISKSYRLYSTPVDRLRDALGWKSNSKDFLALQNISLEINKGEFWGILGKNGSGKSTLLKIISGQVEPSSGNVDVVGKVTLLQLGLGFDPELTGIENIRYSRILQNLSDDHYEIEEFVREFSELGDFINYPVKTYSSGMHSRLSFAIAVAGDPDILIADEVLAVGDMNFSQKCLSKMREFKERGKTVVLVTHDVNTVKAFCDKAAWINDGLMMSQGDAQLVSENYRNYMLYGISALLESANSEACHVGNDDMDQSTNDLWVTPNPNRRSLNKNKLKINQYRFSDAENGNTLLTLDAGKPVNFEIKIASNEDIALHSFGFTLHNPSGMIAVHLNSTFFSQDQINLERDREYCACFHFIVPMLSSGPYSLSFGCSAMDNEEQIIKYDYDSSFEIANQNTVTLKKQGGYVVVPAGEFEIK
jgi:ABC-type polysaccharide/polyol phosphate transport system ATPase subunit